MEEVTVRTNGNSLRNGQQTLGLFSRLIGKKPAMVLGLPEAEVVYDKLNGMVGEGQAAVPAAIVATAELFGVPVTIGAEAAAKQAELDAMAAEAQKQQTELEEATAQQIAAYKQRIANAEKAAKQAAEATDKKVNYFGALKQKAGKVSAFFGA